MKTEFLIVKNNLIAQTKWGERRVINLTNGEAIWINNITANTHIKPKQRIEVVRDPKKNTLSILDREEHLETPTTSTTTNQTYAHHNNNGHSTPSNDEEDILDLPNLSNVDKRKMMEYIRSQSKLLKFCYDTCAEQFPEMKGKDERGLRSLAITLLISANQTRDKYKK